LENKLDDYPWMDPHLVLVRKINGNRIEIYSQADYQFKSHRHSYTVKSTYGSSSSGGYGQDNEIIFPTIDSALMDSLKYVTTKDKLKKLKREIILEKLL
jgi:hypothetical protein